MPATSHHHRRRGRRLSGRGWLVVSAVAVLVIAFGGAAALWRVRDVGAPVPTTLTGDQQGSPTPTPAETGAAASPAAVSATTLPPAARPTTCEYAPAPEGAPGLRRPPPPPAEANLGTVHVDLVTSAGTITLTLVGDAAPCTINSFVHLVRNEFYDNTPCHRLTTSGIFLLQCGDPSGAGTGGPGYQFVDENLPTAAPAYPRGTVAMANGGPGTNGSQFFLVYGDSDIDPNYTVFGTVTGGLDVLDRIAAAGTDDSGGTGDGHPNADVTIESIALS